MDYIRGQRVTQGSMGRCAPRYPPCGPGLFKKLKFPERDNSSLTVKGLNKNVNN